MKRTLGSLPAKAPGIVVVEQHSIDHVPEDERHGNVHDQGPFWFTGNFHFLSIALGFIGPSMGLALGWTILAITLGILFGTLFVAFHATQGPLLGLPQMVQSRAQFGYRGVVVPLLGSFANFVGFNVICALMLMSGLGGLFGWNRIAVLALSAGITASFAIFGHDRLHAVFRFLFRISLPLLTILTISVLAGAVPHGQVRHLGFDSVAFGVVFAACASYNIGYAPFVSDYTRYLPRDTRAPLIITHVFIGASVSAIWLGVLGAWLATRLHTADPLTALNIAGNAMFPGFGTVIVLDSVFVLLGLVSLGNYSGMLTLATIADSLRPLPYTRALRVALILVTTSLWVSATLLFGEGALSALTLTLTLGLYVLTPWTAVNLVDFFFIRHGHYDIADLFRPDGRYGAWAWRGLVPYALGWVAIIPFAVLPGLWTGPFAQRLDGVDIGWLTGLLAAGGATWICGEKVRRPEAQPIATFGQAG